MKKDIHIYFELSYCSYLTLPRSMLQSMPEDWQEKFVELLEQFDELYRNDHPLMPYDFLVKPRDERRRFIRDEISDYNRGRRFVEPNPVSIVEKEM